ncbi:hypothetical protein [Streptomyces sp. WAC08452]|uniref:hypothetical protein n=1 Tax=Streptomyces sp. WAC08452 TaxID=2487414 RepID=UPI000F9DBB49|nr:hypothetical protein [Streptomyces sp. WAC08452]RSS22199.1 hypothetical protein EF916_32855 [Streptomyces sp. WAC08452]
MVDVSAEVGQLAELDELTGPAAAAVLDAAGWTGERRNPAKEWATTWRRADAHAWIQGPGPVVQLEFTVWHRDVDEEWSDPDTYIDELYDAATAELPGLVAQLEAGVPGDRLQRVDDDLTDGADYIDHTAWRISGKVVLAGVKHDDTDAPVQLVVVVRDSSADAEDDGGEWL